jgi:hypothetical protein
MQLADLLVAANLVTAEELGQATGLQAERGGRLADCLMAQLPEKAAQLRSFCSRMPPEPRDIAETGIHPTELMNLLMKQIFARRLESNLQFIDALRLPPHIVDEVLRMAVTRNLLTALGNNGGVMRYEISEQGKRWAQDAMKSSQYIGPAPVPLEQFCARVKTQKVNTDPVTYHDIRRALTGFDVPDMFIHRIGPALNAGRSLLMYGPPGNGKTTVAMSFANVFNSIVYLPHAVLIEGQIMRVFDPSLHQPLHPPAKDSRNAGVTSLYREGADARWVPMRRPFVITGGELTLEMLDLAYDQATGFYEAPLHIKALGGCFVIDDFGRQICTPSTLLNRWIVPMESRIDYLKLHTGKSFSIPFEALVIFSTNLDPDDLMDGAFLRRLPYKLEVGAPSKQTYRAIFDNLAKKAGLEFDDSIFETIVHKITNEKRMQLAAYHARFIIDQVLAISRYLNVPPKFDAFAIGYALDNLSVKSYK